MYFKLMNAKMDGEHAAACAWFGPLMPKNHRGARHFGFVKVTLT